MRTVAKEPSTALAPLPRAHLTLSWHANPVHMPKAYRSSVVDDDLGMPPRNGAVSNPDVARLVPARCRGYHREMTKLIDRCMIPMSCRNVDRTHLPMRTSFLSMGNSTSGAPSFPAMRSRPKETDAMLCRNSLNFRTSVLSEMSGGGFWETCQGSAPRTRQLLLNEGRGILAFFPRDPRPIHGKPPVTCAEALRCDKCVTQLISRGERRKESVKGADGPRQMPGCPSVCAPLERVRCVLS